MVVEGVSSLHVFTFRLTNLQVTSAILAFKLNHLISQSPGKHKFPISVIMTYETSITNHRHGMLILTRLTFALVFPLAVNPENRCLSYSSG